MKTSHVWKQHFQPDTAFTSEDVWEDCTICDAVRRVCERTGKLQYIGKNGQPLVRYPRCRSEGRVFQASVLWAAILELWFLAGDSIAGHEEVGAWLDEWTPRGASK